MKTDKKIDDSSTKKEKRIKSEDFKERTSQQCENKEIESSVNKTINKDTEMLTSKNAEEQLKNTEKENKPTKTILKKSINFDSFFIPILTAIIAGLVIALLSPFIQDWHNESHQIVEQNAQLEGIRLGMSKEHIDDLFGHPIFNNTVSKDYTIEAGGNFIASGYKLHEKSLLCLYQDEKLVAFIIMTTKRNQYSFVRRGLYGVETDSSEYTYTLSDFTFTDYNGYSLESLVNYKGYYPLMGTYYLLYYYEVSGGNHPDNLEYTILGKYRKFMDDKSEIVDLMETAYDLEYDTYGDVEAAIQHLCELREKIHPDVYGLSKYEELDFVMDLIQTDDNAILLNG